MDRVGKRSLVRTAVLKELKTAKKPITVGDLFLKTCHSHPMIISVLNDLKKEGVVDSKVMESNTTTYAGHKSTHKSMHWWLVPEKDQSRNENNANA
jgi:DNA-binding PadR family transcriptional regulator